MEDRAAPKGKAGWDLTKALRNPMALCGMRSSDTGSTIDTEEALAGLINKVSERCNSLRKGHQTQWILNMCNVLGHQNVTPDKATGNIRTTEAASWRVKHVVNMAGMALQRLIAKITRLIPTPEAIPKSSDYRHQRMAREAELYLTSKVEELGLERYNVEWILKAMIYSKAYMKCYWDTSAGEAVYDGEEQFSDGAVSLCVDDPTTLFHEPGVNNICDASWALSVQVKSRGWVADRYPSIDKRLELNKGSGSTEVTSLLDQMFAIIEGTQRIDSENCVVREFWLRPDKRAKDEWKRKGCMFVMVNEIVAQEPEEFPYASGKLPWVELNDAFMQGLGNFGPTCVAQWLTSNHLYNRLTSMVLENLQLCGRPKVLLPKGSNVAQTSFTSDPGEIIEYQPMDQAKPEYMRSADVNQGAFEALANRQLADFDNMTGQHEVSRGISPGAASPAAAIEQLIQADDTVLRLLAGAYRLALTELFRRMLEHEVQFGDPRDIVVYGKGRGSTKTMQFHGKALEYKDIRIEPNSLKPTSPIAMREQIYRLAQVGLLGPFQSPEHEAWAKKVLSTMEWGDSARIFQEANVDRERAQWENDQLDEISEMTKEFNPKLQRYMDIPVLGTLIPNPFDNHTEHIEEHELRQKNLSFNELADIPKRSHLYHVELHKNALVEGTKQPEMIESGLRQAGVLDATTPEQAQAGSPQLNQQAAEAQVAQAQSQAQAPQLQAQMQMAQMQQQAQQQEVQNQMQAQEQQMQAEQAAQAQMGQGQE